MRSRPDPETAPRLNERDKVIKQFQGVLTKAMDSTRRRRFYIITIAVFLIIILFAAVIIVYTEESYAKIEVTGTAHAYFVLSYDSTNTDHPASQNVTVEVLPHVDPDGLGVSRPAVQRVKLGYVRCQGASYGNRYDKPMTPQAGTVKVSPVLSAKYPGSA